MQLTAPLQQLPAEVEVAASVADVPLAAGDDFEGMLALLVELDRVADVTGIPAQVARLSEQRSDGAAGVLGIEATQGGVGVPGGWTQMVRAPARPSPSRWLKSAL